MRDTGSFVIRQVLVIYRLYVALPNTMKHAAEEKSYIPFVIRSSVESPNTISSNVQTVNIRNILCIKAYVKPVCKRVFIRDPLTVNKLSPPIPLPRGRFNREIEKSFFFHPRNIYSISTCAEEWLYRKAC